MLNHNKIILVDEGNSQRGDTAKTHLLKDLAYRVVHY